LAQSGKIDGCRALAKALGGSLLDNHALLNAASALRTAAIWTQSFGSLTGRSGQTLAMSSSLLITRFARSISRR
jgi:hypothetical protein